MSARRLFCDVPAPFIDESPASWLQRICARNAFSITRLKETLKIRGAFDFDVDLREHHWARIHHAMGFEREWEIHRERLRLLRRPWSHETFEDVAREREYSWCPLCFFEDKEPYFRWSWRCGEGLCSVHGTELRAGCQHCGGVPNLTHTFHVRTLNMAHCQGCTRWLGIDPEMLAGNRMRPTWIPNLETRPARVARLSESLRHRVDAIVSGHELPDADPRAWCGSGPTRPMSLRLDWRQFVWPERALDHRRNWSRLTPRNTGSRARLAAALRLVRLELRVAKRAAAAKEAAGHTDEQVTLGEAR
jgi:hypothetical protein